MQDNPQSDETSDGAVSSNDDGCSMHEFTVIFGSDTGHRGPLGIDIDFGHPSYLKIKKVNMGLVSTWNAANKLKRIEIGDLVIEINSESGSSRRLMELIAKQNKLCITIRRPDAHRDLVLYEI